jgi:hypothetical protein
MGELMCLLMAIECPGQLDLLLGTMATTPADRHYRKSHSLMLMLEQSIMYDR